MSKKIQASEDHEIKCILPGNPRRSIFNDTVLKIQFNFNFNLYGDNLLHNTNRGTEIR